MPLPRRLMLRADDTPGAPALNLNFVAMSASGVLDARVTFSRASAATRINASGLIESVASGVPRFTHDPVTLQPLGLLVEEQRTNLEPGTMTADGVTITDNAAIGPDGLLSMALIQCSVSGSFKKSVANTALSSGTIYTRQFWMRAGSVTQARAFVDTATISAARIVRGPGAVSSATPNNTNVGISGLSSSALTLVEITFTVPATLTKQVNCYPGDWNVQNAGDSVYLGFRQTEAGSTATSYIPNPGSGTTLRLADSAQMTGTDFSSWFNAAQGTTTASVSIAASASGSPGIYAIDDGTTNNAFPAFHGGTGATIGANARVSGASVFTSSGGSLSALPSQQRLALTYGPSGYVASFNGGGITTGTGAIPSGLNRLQIGAYNSQTLNAPIASITYYNRALPAATLQRLTA